MDKIYAGSRLRRLREERGMSQVELSRSLAISASYLNQIEHDSRPLTVTVLMRLTEVFGIDPTFFTPRDTARQLAELREALPEAASGEPIPLADLQQVASGMPEVGEAVLLLHRRYRELVDHVESITDSRMEGPTVLPHEHVRDFFYRRQNYIDSLDVAAERTSQEMGHKRGEVRRRLRERLETKHGVRVLPWHDLNTTDTHVFDEQARTLHLSVDLRPGQQAFRMATQLAYLEADELIEEALEEEHWRSDAARALARIGLAHHFAGALILPYTPFFQAAERMKYDVEVLAEHFGLGYETIAHRLSTLQRPGMRGVPFIFVRVDRAGNISKRQSATGFHFSRSGGTCPLWNVYDAFATPGQIDVQVAEMPDGQRYLWVSRTVLRRRGGYGDPAKTFVIGLGCELRQASRLVYSRGIDLSSPDVQPIGPGCRTCDRLRCAQRAAPPIGRTLRIDEDRSSFVPYPLAPVSPS